MRVLVVRKDRRYTGTTERGGPIELALRSETLFLSFRWTVAQKRNPSNQHASVRRDHATELAEDYVEAVAELMESAGECRLVELARRFAVSHVTANRTLARLKRDGLVQSEPYGPIRLTAAGRRLAERCKKRHQIVYDFLVALGISPEEATIDAEGMEHHVGAATLAAMERFASGTWSPSKA